MPSWIRKFGIESAKCNPNAAFSTSPCASSGCVTLALKYLHRSAGFVQDLSCLLILGNIIRCRSCRNLGQLLYCYSANCPQAPGDQSLLPAQAIR